ncbi:MAG: hypothetical protein WD844_07805 [Thermoleophilaceae bacterium]
MSSRGSWSAIALAAATGTLLFAGGAIADRGGVPTGGREDRPQPQGPPAERPQGPPAEQQQPQEKATPPGQEKRPDTAPTPPGQERRSAPRPRRPEPEARPQAAPRSNAAPQSRARPRQSQSPNGPPGTEGNPGGGQDKTTICHATGSDTNPYVEITIANPALPAHRRHGDIVPAPAGGCPGGADRSRERIDICHATGSDTNPYVLLEDMPLPSLNGHGGHEGDIIPAPADGICPTVEQPAGTLTEEIPPSAFAPRSVDDPPPGALGAPGATPVGTPELRSAPGSGGDVAVPVSGVLGTTAEAPAQGSLPAGATGNGSGSDPAAPGGNLPFTGLQLLVLLALGVTALSAGVAIRRGGAVHPA